MPDSKPVVLAVDDTPSNLDLLREILSDDYTVRVATNGEKALELACRQPLPDIVLLDIMMPGMDGYEVCRELKEDPDTTPIPVIFVTAMAQVEDEQRGLALGAVDYITKPYDPEIVKARVKKEIANYQKTCDLIRENRELREVESRSFTTFDAGRIKRHLRDGESNHVEFKSTLRWNMHADRSDKSIENSCLKTVAGYLNADGGVLLIGVDDDGEVLGLGNDHFKTEDKFLLHWVNLLKSYLGAEFIPYVRSMAHNVDGKRVLVVECLPSTKPVFFRRDNDESFFVRMGNTTQALKPSEIIAYIEQHFGEKQARVGDLTAQGPSPAQKTRLSDATGIMAWIAELQERRVLRSAVLYIAIAWGFAESATFVAESLNAPDWVSLVIVYAFIAGFPLVVLLSWVFDMRVVRDEAAVSSSSRKKTIWLIVVLIVLSVAVIWRFATFDT